MAGWTWLSAFATSLVACIWATTARDVWQFFVVFLVLNAYLITLSVITRRARDNYEKRLRMPMLERYFGQMRFVIAVLAVQVLALDVILLLRNAPLVALIGLTAGGVLVIAASLVLWKMFQPRFLQDGWRW